MTSFTELREQARSNDSVALSQLLLAHYDRLLLHVADHLPAEVQSVVGPEDVLQQVFVDAIRDIGTCKADSETAFHAWLRTIADHRVVDTVRSLKRQKRGGEFRRVEVRDSSGTSVGELVRVLADRGLTPSKELAQGEAKQAIEVALAVLPDDHRRAIQLYYGDDQDIAGVAREMGRTTGAVRGLLDRARRKLRDILGSASKFFSVR